MHGVNLLRLRAAPGAEGKVALIAEPRYAEVMVFEDCGILELAGLTLGHTEEGFCQGGVLMFKDCESLTTLTIDLTNKSWDVERMTVRDSVIHDCSYGIMELYRTAYAEFDGCAFRDCREYTMLTVVGSAAFFNDCVFRNNYWGQYGSFLACTDDDQTIVMFSGCELSDYVKQELASMEALGKHIGGDWE